MKNNPPVEFTFSIWFKISVKLKKTNVEEDSFPSSTSEEEKNSFF